MNTQKEPIILDYKTINAIIDNWYKFQSEVKGFEHIPAANWSDRVFTANALYQSVLQENDITSTISEWRNHFAADAFTNSLCIKYKGNLVYKARISRYSLSPKTKVIMSQSSEWIKKILAIRLSYDS